MHIFVSIVAAFLVIMYICKFIEWRQKRKERREYEAMMEQWRANARLGRPLHGDAQSGKLGTFSYLKDDE